MAKNDDTLILLVILGVGVFAYSKGWLSGPINQLKGLFQGAGATPVPTPPALPDTGTTIPGIPTSPGGQPIPDAKPNPTPPSTGTGTGTSFIAVGDWDNKPASSKTVAMAASSGVPLILGLGDYPYDGDTKASIQAVLRPILSKMKAVLGNHEDNSWLSIWGQSSAEFTFNMGNVCFIMCNTEPNGSNSHVEAACAKAQADPNIDFIVTCGHRPTTPNFAGVATGGVYDAKANALVPIWNKYSKVKLVLSGHFHNYQRSKPANAHGTVYCVVGTAGATLYSARNKPAGVAVQVNGYHGFLRVDTTRAAMNCKFVTHNNGVMDSFVISK